MIHVERAGATIAEVPVFDDGCYPSTVAAVEDTLTLFIDKRDVRRLCLHHPEISLSALKVLASRLRRCAELIEELSLHEDGYHNKAMDVGRFVRVASAGALSTYAFAVRPWHLRWGATRAEAKETLPGDEVVPHPKSEATHAITINAPVENVWSWLVQIGQDKGGFYSYSWLENLVGCQWHNADRILPEFQSLKVGDGVRLHPKVPPLPVLMCKPYKTIVLGSNTENPGTWAFYLKKIDEKRTRLIIRGRGEWRPGLLNWLFNYVVFEPAHFIMKRKMLLTLKERAEESVADESNMPRQQPALA